MIAALVTAAFVVVGAAFTALAGLGVVRMPDVYTRMHTATKAGTLGAGLVLVAVAVHFGDLGVILRVAAAIFFIGLTAPVAAHMIGRAAYRSGVPLWEGSVVDQWDGQSAAVAPTGRDDGQESVRAPDVLGPRG